MVGVLQDWIIGSAVSKFVTGFGIDFALKIVVSTHGAIADFDVDI